MMLRKRITTLADLDLEISMIGSVASGLGSLSRASAAMQKELLDLNKSLQPDLEGFKNTILNFISTLRLLRTAFGDSAWKKIDGGASIRILEYSAKEFRKFVTMNNSTENRAHLAHLGEEFNKVSFRER